MQGFISEVEAGGKLGENGFIEVEQLLHVGPEFLVGRTITVAVVYLYSDRYGPTNEKLGFIEVEQLLHVGPEFLVGRTITVAVEVNFEVGQDIVGRLVTFFTIAFEGA